MGYALDIQQFIDYKVLFETYSSYATDSDRTAINQSKNYTDLMTVVERVMRRYMNDKLGYNGYTSIYNYNSSIGSPCYPAVYPWLNRLYTGIYHSIYGQLYC